MIRIFLALVFILLISGCATKPIEEVSSLSYMVETCSALCEGDQEDYCIGERELVFEDGSKTFGSCRAFSRYNEQFTKCEGYCTEYGKGPKCKLEDGAIDDNCDGK